MKHSPGLPTEPDMLMQPAQIAQTNGRQPASQPSVSNRGARACVYEREREAPAVAEDIEIQDHKLSGVCNGQRVTAPANAYAIQRHRVRHKERHAETHRDTLR